MVTVTLRQRSPIVLMTSGTCECMYCVLEDELVGFAAALQGGGMDKRSLTAVFLLRWNLDPFYFL
jgi:hypothetical protein